MHCNALQRTAPHLNTLSSTATHCNPLDSLQRTTTHCNALQRTATHCNALRPTNSTRAALTYSVPVSCPPLALSSYPLCCNSSVLSLARTVYTLYSTHYILQITHDVFLCRAPCLHGVFFVVVTVFLACTVACQSLPRIVSCASITLYCNPAQCVSAVLSSPNTLMIYIYTHMYTQ